VASARRRPLRRLGSITLPELPGRPLAGPAEVLTLRIAGARLPHHGGAAARPPSAAEHEPRRALAVAPCWQKRGRTAGRARAGELASARPSGWTADKPCSVHLLPRCAGTSSCCPPVAVRRHRGPAAAPEPRGLWPVPSRNAQAITPMPPVSEPPSRLPLQAEPVDAPGRSSRVHADDAAKPRRALRVGRRKPAPEP